MGRGPAAVSCPQATHFHADGLPCRASLVSRGGFAPLRAEQGELLVLCGDSKVWKASSGDLTAGEIEVIFKYLIMLIKRFESGDVRSVAMRRRGSIVISMPVGAVVALLLAFAWARPCPLDLKLVSVETCDVWDEAGNQPVLVTLSLSSQDRVSVLSQTNAAFQARINNRWVDLNQTLKPGTIRPGQGYQAPVLMPAGTDACRLSLDYQYQYELRTWKHGFIDLIGLRARTFVAKSPILSKWVWPDEFEVIRVASESKRVTLEMSLLRHDVQPVRESSGNPK